MSADYTGAFVKTAMLRLSLRPYAEGREVVSKSRMRSEFQVHFDCAGGVLGSGRQPTRLGVYLARNDEPFQTRVLRGLSGRFESGLDTGALL